MRQRKRSWGFFNGEGLQKIRVEKGCRERIEKTIQNKKKDNRIDVWKSGCLIDRKDSSAENFLGKLPDIFFQ